MDGKVWLERNAVEKIGGQDDTAVVKWEDSCFTQRAETEASGKANSKFD